MSDPDFIQDHRLLMTENLPQIQEIVREAEERLKMQVQMALAADTRAGQMAAVQAGGAIALVVAATQNLSSGALWAAVASACFLGLGAISAIFGALPIAFGMIGTRPKDWLEPVATREGLSEGLAGYAMWLDKYLFLNDRQMATNNNWFRIALGFMALSPVAGGLAALFAS